MVVGAGSWELISLATCKKQEVSWKRGKLQAHPQQHTFSTKGASWKSLPNSITRRRPRIKVREPTGDIVHLSSTAPIKHSPSLPWLPFLLIFYIYRNTFDRFCVWGIYYVIGPVVVVVVVPVIHWFILTWFEIKTYCVSPSWSGTPALKCSSDPIAHVAGTGICHQARLACRLCRVSCVLLPVGTRSRNQFLYVLST